jgi:hypothetical protein
LEIPKGVIGSLEKNNNPQYKGLEKNNDPQYKGLEKNNDPL